MPAAEYEFVTIWEVAGTPDEVFDILDDPADLARWWPSVYLDVVVDEPGDERGVGKVVSLVTKGWLPYRLRWSFRVTEKDRPTRIALDPWGDLDEHDGWMITPHGALVRARYDWRVRADNRCSGTCRSCSSQCSRRTIGGRCVHAIREDYLW